MDKKELEKDEQEIEKALEQAKIQVYRLNGALAFIKEKINNKKGGEDGKLTDNKG